MNNPARIAKRAQLKKIIDELNNTSPECLEALNELYVMKLEDEIELMKEMLRAVRITEFDGVYHDNVRGKNWFDARDSLLN